MQNNSSSSTSITGELAAWILKGILRWRTELLMILIPLIIFDFLVNKLGIIFGVVVMTLLLAVFFCPKSVRKAIKRTFHCSKIRRHVTAAFGCVGGRLSQYPPAITGVVSTLGGEHVGLRLRPGTSVEDIKRCTDVIAVALGVREVRIKVDATRMCNAFLTIIYRNPFEFCNVPFPLLGLEHFNSWNPIPVGVDEDGKLVTLLLPERNLLIGAEPGGGKSVALSLLVAGFALDPSVDLWLFDGKLVELAPWSSCAKKFVGIDINEAINALELLRSEMEIRYEVLLATGLRKIIPGSNLPLNVVVIDELSLYVAGVDKKLSAKFTELLRDLVARGRAAGIIVLAATQKPSTDIIPSALRDLFGFRWAFRCATRDASDTVLGSGWASQGYSASDIDPRERGVGLLLHEGGVPVRLRTFHLNDQEIATISQIASKLRQTRPNTREL